MAVCSYVSRSGGLPSLVAMLPQRPGYDTADDGTVHACVAVCSPDRVDIHRQLPSAVHVCVCAILAPGVIVYA
jgi:hypothetical protein